MLRCFSLGSFLFSVSLKVSCSMYLFHVTHWLKEMMSLFHHHVESNLVVLFTKLMCNHYWRKMACACLRASQHWKTCALFCVSPYV
jgi:hypothetical protein